MRNKKNKFLKILKRKKTKLIKSNLVDIFDYEPSTLVGNLLNQSKQDLKKNLDEIEQQKIKLNADERNSTNNTVKMTDLTWYWLLLTKFFNFLSINFCQPNNQMN